MARQSRRAVTRIGSAQINVIQYPTGRWGFVGAVPAELSFEGSPEDLETVRCFGMIGNLKDRVKSLSWESRDAAIAAATAKGHTVANA